MKSLLRIIMAALIFVSSVSSANSEGLGVLDDLGKSQEGLQQVSRRLHFPGTHGTGARPSLNEVEQQGARLVEMRDEVETLISSSDGDREARLLALSTYFASAVEFLRNYALVQPRLNFADWSARFQIKIPAASIQDAQMLTALGGFSQFASQNTSSIVAKLNSLPANGEEPYVLFELNPNLETDIEMAELVGNPTEQSYVDILRLMSAQYLLQTHHQLSFLEPNIAELQVDQDLLQKSKSIRRMYDSKASRIQSMASARLVADVMESFFKLIDDNAQQLPLFIDEALARKILDAQAPGWNLSSDGGAEILKNAQVDLANLEREASFLELLKANLAGLISLTDLDYSSKDKLMTQLAHAWGISQRVYFSQILKGLTENVDLQKSIDELVIRRSVEHQERELKGFINAKFKLPFDAQKSFEYARQKERADFQSRLLAQKDLLKEADSLVKDEIHFKALGQALRPGLSEGGGGPAYQFWLNQILSQNSYSEAQSTYFQILAAYFKRTEIQTDVYGPKTHPQAPLRIDLAKVHSLSSLIEKCLNNSGKSRPSNCPNGLYKKVRESKIAKLNPDFIKSEFNDLKALVVLGERIKFFDFQSNPEVRLSALKLNDDELELYVKAQQDEVYTSAPILMSKAPAPGFFKSMMNKVNFFSSESSNDQTLYEKLKSSNGNAAPLIEEHLGYTHESIQGAMDSLVESEDLIELGNLVSRSAFLSKVTELQPGFLKWQSSATEEFFSASPGMRLWDKMYDLYIMDFFTYLMAYQIVRVGITWFAPGAGKVLKLLEDGSMGTWMKEMFITSTAVIGVDIVIDSFHIFGHQATAYQQTEDFFYSNLGGDPFVNMDSLKEAQEILRAEKAEYWMNSIMQVGLLGGAMLFFMPRSMMTFERIRSSIYFPKLSKNMVAVGLGSQSRLLRNSEMISQSAKKAKEGLASISDDTKRFFNQQQITLAEQKLVRQYSRAQTAWYKKGLRNRAEFDILGLAPGSWHPEVLKSAFSRIQTVYRNGQMNQWQFEQAQRAYFHLSGKVHSHSVLAQSDPLYRNFIEGVWMSSNKLPAGSRPYVATASDEALNQFSGVVWSAQNAMHFKPIQVGNLRIQQVVYKTADELRAEMAETLKATTEMLRTGKLGVTQ